MSIDPTTPEDYSAYENRDLYHSPLLKAINCIPVVNIVSSIVFDYFLTEQMAKETELSKIVDWIELKNQYKICHLVSNVASALFTVILCATLVINTAIPTIILLALTIQTAKGIIRNWQVIDRINYPNERLKSTILMLVD